MVNERVTHEVRVREWANKVERLQIALFIKSDVAKTRQGPAIIVGSNHFQCPTFLT